MAYDNTNTFTLFKNENKKQDSHADYEGTININGVDYWLNGWIRTAGPQSKTPGKKFIGGTFKPKQSSGKAPQRREEPSADIPDDDVPF